jgi:hypothetical protein
MTKTKTLACALLLLACGCGDSGNDAADDGDLDLVGASPPVEFAYTGGIQTIVVPPNVRTALIKVIGAGGGIGIPRSGYPDRHPGRGVSMSGDFSVEPGETLAVLVGGRGQDSKTINGGFGQIAAGGGGGASAVWRGSTFADMTPENLMIIAGGGGGQGSYEDNGDDASMSRDGHGSGSAHSGYYPGGTKGSGGEAYPCIGGGGGGGGVFGAGVDAGKGGRSCFGAGGGGKGGAALNLGGAGGAAASPTSGYSGESGAGGFGGGGGGGNAQLGCGGGGGGYSGGAGGLKNGGGDFSCGGAGAGSYSVATIQINKEGVGTGDGSASISFK